MKKVLIVDDDANQLKVLSRLLRSNKFDVEAVTSGEEALEKIDSTDFDLVLLDQVMPDMSGIDVLTEIKKLRPRICVIMITGFATIDDAVEATKKGGRFFKEISKIPLNPPLPKGETKKNNFSSPATKWGIQVHFFTKKGEGDNHLPLRKRNQL